MMGKIKIIKDGNFTRWFRLFLIVFGISAMYFAVDMMRPSVWSGIALWGGLCIAAIGGYASQAHMLKIKPFGNNWRKIRKTYEKEDGDA